MSEPATDTLPSLQGQNALRSYVKQAAHYRLRSQAAVAINAETWDILLLNDVFDALAETNPLERSVKLAKVATTAEAEQASIVAREGRLFEDPSPEAA